MRSSKIMKKAALILFFLPLLLVGKVDFVHEVMPVLKKRCAECHAGEKKKGGLSMNTRAAFLAGGENGEVAVPGKPKESYFLDAVTSDDPDERMPPKGDPLTKEQVAKLTAWVAEGMIWDEGIRLGDSGWEPPLKPRVVSLPKAREGRNHPIDRLLDDYLAKNGKPMPKSSEERPFVRRAYLDVVGLLPSPKDLEEFSASRSGKKREELIDALLADDVAYADHWLTFWNDLLRNDYTGTGFITGGRKQITTWLYAALRENKPYDEMTRELIDAGKDASGFINGIKWRGNVNASQTVDMQFAQNVSQVFLGLNMKCASCHDSFIDRWTLEEAYGLASIFASKPLELTRCDKPLGKKSTAKWIFPELGEVDPKAPKAERLKQLAGLMTHPENGRFTRTIVNRIWARLMGRGIVHPVDAMDTRPWNEDLLDYLAVRFAEDGHDLRKFIRFVMTSEAYQAESVFLPEEPGEDYVYTGPVPKRMTAEQFMDSIWQVTRTHPAKIEAKVDRSARDKASKKPNPNALPKPGKITAKWIWGPDPNTRKIRLRKRIVLDAKPASASFLATCDNAFSLRINGKGATSSKDWTKPVYLQAASFFKKGENLIEVDAEMFGGASGFVAQFVIGKDKKLVETDKSWEVAKGKEWDAATEVHPYGKGPWKRVLDNARETKAGVSPGSAPPIRAALVKNDFLMRSLGRPHRDQVVTSRPSELTTLQAIDLANGQILADYLSKGAKALGAEKKPARERIDWLFRHALARKPSDAESAVLAEVAKEDAGSREMEDLLWMVFMHPEFQIIR
ncbi:MAG TPA: hypothetical protein DCG39_01570 [Opitutae bacterium]|nr:hypothetical protein [Opitutae bacterium]